MKLDVLVKIPDQDLPKLATLYEKEVTWAPYVVGFIKMAIKWKKSEKYRENLTFMSPNNCWEQDGTIIVLMKNNSYDLFIFTLEDSCENLYSGLSGTRRIDFAREVYFFNVHEKHVETMYRVIKEKRLEIMSDHDTVMYTIEPKAARNFEIICPADVYIKELDQSHVNLINSKWPLRKPGSETFISILIEMNGGFGVFLKQNDELVAWTIRHCLGHLGILQTVEEHKNKGFGSLIIKVLAKETANENIWPFGPVIKTNIPSRNMFKKLGFSEIGSAAITTVRPIKRL